MDDFLYFNIERFLSRKRSRISRQKRSALILRWLTLPSMSESLRIIDRKVCYLLDASGEGKLNQWLLSNDIDFTTITAERYIIDYLKSRNSNIEDNLRRAGIDALLNFENQRVGIEITTLNSFIAEWIFMERLTEFLSERRCMDNKTLRITFSSRRIVREFGNDSLYGYLETVGNCILSNDIDCYSGLEILLETEHRWSGYISWELKDKDSFPWLKCLTGDLLNKIAAKGKTRQLNKNTKNLVFVGVNHVAPLNWAIPSIFEEIGRGGISYEDQINNIKEFWQGKLMDYPYILGVCYFYYSLEKEIPFYPLRIFWRNEAEQIELNL